MAVTKFYYILYLDMHNFKIVKSHNEDSAVRDWAKSLHVNKSKIQVKLVTEDMQLAESRLTELIRVEYEAESKVKERDRLNEPIITTYDIYISRLREIGLANIVKTPELEAAYRDWMHESGYNYYTPQT
jgi:hypothetical protein